MPPQLHLIALPTPFPVGPVNVYLAEGEPLTLIDTGPKADVSRTALEAALQTQGYRVEDLRRVILTHHHADHVGLAAEIVARSGAEVWTHPYNVPLLNDYEAERDRNRPFYRQLWVESGVPADIVEAMDKAGSGLSKWQDPVNVTQLIEEGDRLTFANATWQVFHTPGHAGGLICLWEATSRTLLANDHILNHISSNPVLEAPRVAGEARPQRLVQYIHHMQRMAALNPALALPGHGELVTDVVGLVNQRVKFHLRRADKIAEALAERPLTLWELVKPIFPRLTRGLDFFLALSEILGHLDILVERSVVEAKPDGEQVRWGIKNTAL